MTEATGKPRRFAKLAAIALPLGILTVILLSVGTVGVVQFSSSPLFCRSCHNMEPYYESWKTSTHNQVACIECHFAPGIRGEAMGKMQAVNQLVKYVTGTYGLRP